jgi:hypothetical protein
MKKEQTEELFVKWVDGRLNNEEQSQLDELFAADRELETELTGAKDVTAVLQSEIPKSVEPAYPDFFNSQLMRKVDLEIAAQRPVEKAARWVGVFAMGLGSGRGSCFGSGLLRRAENVPSRKWWAR